MNENDLPFISVIVLNYNSLVHLGPNLDSLLSLDYPLDRLEILLVDNASNDVSVEWAAVNYPTVRIVHNEANLGYAGGNNAGARVARGEWIAILNPDMRVRRDWLRELVQRGLRDSAVVCVASKVLSWDGEQIDFADAAINFLGWGCQPGYGSRRIEDFSQDKFLLFANGGAMLIRRDVFLDVGGFDVDYFAYYEDVDLGWRLWLYGYKVIFASGAVVYHQHHGSWTGVNAAKTWLLAERNTLFTIIKNYEEDYLAFILPAVLLLLLYRAYLDVWPDPSVFAGGYYAPPTTAVFGLRYYLEQGQALVRRGQWRELGRRALAEVERRWENRGKMEPQPGQRPYQKLADGKFTAPPILFSRLLAGQDVLAAWPALLARRETVQKRRQRADAAIFPLFQWALVSNFDDGRFIHAMNHVITKFHLDNLFDATRPSPSLMAETCRLSQELSLILLQQMAEIFACSNVPEKSFRLGEAQPEKSYTLPVSLVARLAEVNTILWTLPDAPLAATLQWLKERMTD